MTVKRGQGSGNPLDAVIRRFNIDVENARSTSNLGSNFRGFSTG
jgi:hypothetical protein